jgi:hypothetical protein
MQVMCGEPAVRACGCDGFTLGHWPLIVAAVLATALHVVTASSDGTARIWDAPSGKEIAVLQVHDSGVWSANQPPSAGPERTPRRQSDGGTPINFLKARLKAASDS